MNIEYAREEFQVGNLYFNRGCTVAIGRLTTFWWLTMAGTDSKAGGSDYLTIHKQAKSTSKAL